MDCLEHTPYLFDFSAISMIASQVGAPLRGEGQLNAGRAIKHRLRPAWTGSSTKRRPDSSTRSSSRNAERDNHLPQVNDRARDRAYSVRRGEGADRACRSIIRLPQQLS